MAALQTNQVILPTDVSFAVVGKALSLIHI